MNWYQPRETDAGGNAAALPRTKPEDRGMTGEALEAVAKLADQKNASALLVARADAIVLQRYWRGLAPDGQTNDGHSKQRVYIMPASALVVVRVGENARGWNEAALTNASLRAVTPSAAQPEPRH